jgi:hypothetical protein
MKYRVKLVFDDGGSFTAIPMGSFENLNENLEDEWIRVPISEEPLIVRIVQLSKIRFIDVEEIPDETNQAPN